MSERRGAVRGLPTGDEWDRVVRLLRLSCRQAEVIHALLRNMTVLEAAAALGIRPDTVKTYLKRTYQRLEVTSRVELAICIMAAARSGPVALPGDTRAGGLRTRTAPRYGRKVIAKLP